MKPQFSFVGCDLVSGISTIFRWGREGTTSCHSPPPVSPFSAVTRLAGRKRCLSVSLTPRRLLWARTQPEGRDGTVSETGGGGCWVGCVLPARRDYGCTTGRRSTGASKLPQSARSCSREARGVALLHRVQRARPAGGFLGFLDNHARLLRTRATPLRSSHNST